ncbi:O-antigen ligase family protein [Parafilimonas sp.]|uniref:O-antigen ligase family protein n=1 Tax=Parafilimonas sp. TaxID=1969739 RepID=UPI003F7CF50B
MAFSDIERFKDSLSLKIGRFLHKIFIEQKLNNIIGYILIAFFAIALGYLFAAQTTLGIGIAGLICGVAVVLACMLDTLTGLFINLIYSYFAFAFSRFFFNDEFPTGVASDILMLATLFSFFVKRVHLKKTVDEFVHTPVVIAILALFFYLMIELFNPYARSFDGWFQTIRKSLGTLVFLFIAYKAFDSYESVRKFLTGLFIVCTITGLYGCIQQWHGLFDYERAWAMADDNRFGLIFIAGDFRKFSTMSDPTAYGIMMASCGIFYLIIAVNEKRLPVKLTILAGVILMFLGMAYSGTRTANAMAAAGLVMFMLLTINKKSTQIFTVFAVLGFVALMYGPFYGNATVNRFRTTFNSTNDDSYKVRETNRAFIQPYIYSHPIGGGLCTTGAGGLRFNPSHYLAGFPPDSGYLKKALETGWIGLIFICVLYFVVLKNCIRGYFDTDDADAKVLYAASCAFLFSFYIADFAQDAIGQITDTVVYYPIIALTLKLKDFRKSEEDSVNTQKRENPELKYT